MGLLVLDLILSAAIFLVLPLVLWEIPDFLQAIRFQGPRPCLGILFWSTFSTSVVFYLFVASSLLARPLAHLPQFGKYLNVEFWQGGNAEYRDSSGNAFGF